MFWCKNCRLVFLLTDLVLVATLISVSLTVDAIIGNQTFQNGRCYVYFTLALDKVETAYNLLTELKKCLIVHIHIGFLAVSSSLLVEETLSLIFKKVAFYC